MKRTIPEQLTKADYFRLGNRRDREQAEADGRVRVLDSGRDPLPFEVAGERFASTEEAGFARINARKAEAAEQRRRDARAGITEEWANAWTAPEPNNTTEGEESQ